MHAQDSSVKTSSYARFARWVLANTPTVWGLTLLVTLLSAVVGMPPDIDANLLSLLPKDDVAAIALRSLNDEEGGANLVTLAFEGEDPEKLDAVLDTLVQELEALDTVDFALHKIDDDLAFRVGLMSLTPDEIAGLNVRLRAALALGSALNPLVTQRLMDMGPVTDRIANAGSSNILMTDSGQARLVARPNGSNLDPAFCEQLIVDIERIINNAKLDENGVTHVASGGGYYNTVEDLRAIRADLIRTSLVSGGLVLIIIMVAFRSLRAVALLIPPLIIANVVNIGLTEVLIGSLNTYTSFGTAILIGLGIAFAVHLVGRYREERLGGYDVDAAIERAWAITGPPCMTAALTSAAGFLALAVGQFRGFYQLGTVLATGLMLSLGFMLLLLPALLRWLDPNPKYALLGASADVERSTTSSYRWAPAGLMIASVFTLVVGFASLPTGADFEYDLSNMRRDGLAWAEMNDEERAFAIASYTPVIASYDSEAEVRSNHARLQLEMEQGRLPHVSRIVSIESVLPHDQETRVMALQETAKLLGHRNLRYLPPPFVKSMLRLRGFEGKSLTVDDIPESLRTLIGASGGRHRILLFLKGNMWDLRENDQLLTEINRAVKRPGGAFLAQGSLFRTVMVDMPRIAFVALILVALLSAIDLKKPMRVVVAISVLLAGMLWAGVAIKWMGIKLTMVNIVGVPILLGIGVDVVIHLLHRIEEEGPGGLRRALRTTGVAASIGTLITIASFASLTQASHRGVAGLGALVVIGLIGVFLATVILLPLAWSAGWKITGRAPSDTMQ